MDAVSAARFQRDPLRPRLDIRKRRRIFVTRIFVTRGSLVLIQVVQDQPPEAGSSQRNRGGVVIPLLGPAGRA